MKRLSWRLPFALTACPAPVAFLAAGSATAGGSSQIPIAGTGTPQTGDFTPSAGDVTLDEFPTGGESDEGPDPYNGTISLSTGAGGGPSVNSVKKAKSNPTFNFGFEGLNHYQQRFARGGNQFSLEPPDQGMCAGNGYVVEAVNDVFNVFSASTGASLLPDNTATNIVSGFPRNVNHAVDLNSFYGYAPAINRATGVRGPFVTDPTCLYDAATQRFFVVVLTLETVPKTGAFTTVNHLDMALSLSNRILTVGDYGVPPKQRQPGSGTLADKNVTPDVPQGDCINDTTTQLFNGQFGCWRLLFGAEPAHTEVISRPDSNDTRMQQVMYANGKVWGALDTALNPDAGPQRAGLAWYIVNPDAGSVVKQGYLGATGYDFTYPAIGVTASGRGVIAFTATGDTLNPSAAYAPIDANAGVGAWNVVTGGTGAAAHAGLTSYKPHAGRHPPG